MYYDPTLTGGAKVMRRTIHKSIPGAILCLLIAAWMSPAIADDHAGDYLYRVTTVRAAPGTLSNLLDGLSDLYASDFFADTAQVPPLVMRHSQGDQWDLMIISPMNSWQDYYAKNAMDKRGNATLAATELYRDLMGFVAFSEDHFALGPDLAIIAAAYAANDFYHIEMFRAVAGKSAELYEQRRMENAYLEATGQVENMIFRRAAGSDIDVFTIGFHPSLAAFAAPADVTDDKKESAAREAGFDGLSDISFYLRSLISGHHDTLAVKVSGLQ